MNNSPTFTFDWIPGVRVFRDDIEELQERLGSGTTLIANGKQFDSIGDAIRRHGTYLSELKLSNYRRSIVFGLGARTWLEQDLAATLKTYLKERRKASVKYLPVWTALGLFCLLSFQLFISHGAAWVSAWIIFDAVIWLTVAISLARCKVCLLYRHEYQVQSFVGKYGHQLLYEIVKWGGLALLGGVGGLAIQRFPKDFFNRPDPTPPATEPHREAPKDDVMRRALSAFDIAPIELLNLESAFDNGTAEKFPTTIWAQTRFRMTLRNPLLEGRPLTIRFVVTSASHEQLRDGQSVQGDSRELEMSEHPFRVWLDESTKDSERPSHLDLLGHDGSLIMPADSRYIATFDFETHRVGKGFLRVDGYFQCESHGEVLVTPLVHVVVPFRSENPLPTGLINDPKDEIDYIDFEPMTLPVIQESKPTP